MNDDRIVELINRERIRDCLYRYCRGVDRSDVESLRSAYWPDATDQHGAYHGSAQGFIEWAVNYFPFLERSIHQLGNILIEFRNRGAAVETYWSAYQRGPRFNPDGTMTPVQSVILAGRYIDWFEQRDGEWRIARRVVVFDRSEVLPPEAPLASSSTHLMIGRSWPHDAIYTLLAEC